MTFTGSILYHSPSEPEGQQGRGTTCLYCGDDWPCEPVQIKRQVLALAVAKVEDMPTMRGGATLDLDTLDRVRDALKEI
jgi:hypothetical protein